MSKEHGKNKGSVVCSKESKVPNNQGNVEREPKLKIFRSKYEKIVSSVRTPVSKIEYLQSQIHKSVSSCNESKINVTLTMQLIYMASER